MLKMIIQKEIRNHLLSFRFQVILALFLVVVPLTILILTNDYVRKLDDYSTRQAGIEEYLKNYAHFNRIGPILQPSQPPLPLYTLIRGLTGDINMDQFDDDPLPIMFPLLDLTFIVAFLMSLAALIFSYDAVSGEREDGTLKLMLSNGVSRARILLGKIAGGSAALLIPFTASFLLGLLVIMINPRVGWKASDWGSVALLMFGVALYTVLFYCLGILVSAMHKESSSSIMTSLFVWVLLVLIVPNMSPYAASLMSPAPSRIKIGLEAGRMLDVERDDLGRKLARESEAAVLKQYPELAGVERMSDAERGEAAKKDPNMANALQAWGKAVDDAWAKANEIQGAKAEALTGDLDRKEKAQTALALRLSMVSPLADFTYLATDLSNTGMRNNLHFAELASVWDKGSSDFIHKEVERMRVKSPGADPWNTLADVSGMPRFRYIEESLVGRFRAVLAPLSVMLVVSVLLFAGAYVSFIRYDAR